MSTIVGFYCKSPIETGGANSLTGTRGGNLIEPAPWVTSHNYVVSNMVSSANVAYVCNTAHTSGASLSADSAKWDSLGACSQAPIATIGTVYTIYFRAVDTATNSDPGQDSATNVIFTPPANSNVQVSADGSTGWVSYPSTLTLSVKVTGGNQPIYVKQTTYSTSSPAQLQISPFGWVTGSRVAQVGTVTATTGDSSVNLSWADISSETGYEVDRATDSSFTTNLVHLTTSLAANSTSYANNTANGNAPVNDTVYYYRVRGYNANGVGAWSNSVSSTPSNLFTFTGVSGVLPNTLYPSEFTVPVVYGTNKIATDGAGNLAYTKTSINASRSCEFASARAVSPANPNSTYKIKFSISSTSLGRAGYFYIIACYWYSNGNPVSFPIDMHINLQALSLCVEAVVNDEYRYYKTDGSGTYNTNSDTIPGYYYTLATNIFYVAQLDTTATNIRLRLFDSTGVGTPLYDSSSIALSSLPDLTNSVIMRYTMGDQLPGNYGTMKIQSIYDVVT